LAARIAATFTPKNPLPKEAQTDPAKHSEAAAREHSEQRTVRKRFPAAKPPNHTAQEPAAIFTSINTPIEWL
jgi:hypothetical protein